MDRITSNYKKWNDGDGTTPGLSEILQGTPHKNIQCKVRTQFVCFFIFVWEPFHFTDEFFFSIKWVAQCAWTPSN